MTATRPSTDRPNIVLIMTDQQRADFSAAMGYPLDVTPFMDDLALTGVRFARAYTPMPACAPARCSLLTGRYPKATRVRENRGVSNLYATTDLPRLLREHGYRVSISGKNHSHLTEADFDWSSFYMHHGGGRHDLRSDDDDHFDRWLESLDHGVHPKPTSFPLECQLPVRIVDDAIACLNSRDPGRPFFHWLSFPEPHNPYQVPEPYFSMFPETDIPDRAAGPEALAGKPDSWRWLRTLIESKRPGYDDHWRRYRANYLGMIRLIDDQVRRFVSYLDSQGLRESTTLIVASDHGDYAGDYGLQRKGAGLPECLVRVPLTVTGPRIKAVDSPREECVSLVDVFPTVCGMLGLPLPDGVQGRSLWPILSGDPFPEAEFRSVYAELGVGGLPYRLDERPPLHFAYDGPGFDELNSVTQGGITKMVRMGPWKLVVDAEGRGELYNLELDPAELHNRFSEPGLSVVQLGLTTELLCWTIRTEDDLPGGSYNRKHAAHNWHVLDDPAPSGSA
ncbi:MAG TPA: sulfatase-like hydrolase/transferase [Thermomicrobiales bacterium]|nr:sulfatase-like hydrolase/transferase [Thermomicrobiales bacterium]